MKPVYDDGWGMYDIPRELGDTYDDLYPLRREPFAGWRVRTMAAARRGLWS